MKVRLLFFAVLRDITGSDHQELALADGTTPRQVWDSLRNAHATLAAYTQPPMIAINESYADADAALREGDELAFIPPRGGRMTYLTDDPIDPRALVARVMRDSDGAYVLFEGVVRNHHEGKSVQSIFYDAYRPMAEKEIDRIVAEVANAHPDVAVAIVHRLGLLVVGDASIAIAAAAPHRAEAFAACRMVIDRIKQTVPIWKKERGPDGEEWLGWQRS